MKQVQSLGIPGISRQISFPHRSHCSRWSKLLRYEWTQSACFGCLFLAQPAQVRTWTELVSLAEKKLKRHRREKRPIWKYFNCQQKMHIVEKNMPFLIMSFSSSQAGWFHRFTASQMCFLQCPYGPHSSPLLASKPPNPYMLTQEVIPSLLPFFPLKNSLGVLKDWKSRPLRTPCDIFHGWIPKAPSPSSLLPPSCVCMRTCMRMLLLCIVVASFFSYLSKYEGNKNWRRGLA